MDYSNNGSKRQKRKLSPHTARVKNKAGLLFIRAFVAVVLIGGFATMGIGMGLYMGIINNAPEIHTEHLKPTNYTTFIYDNAGREIDRLHSEQNRVYATLDKIPMDLRNAFIAIEDKRFYTHNGIDVRGIGRALSLLVLEPSGSPQGASTITQQLLKNKLGRFDSDLTTKLQEQWLAVQFEKRLAEPDMFGSKEAAKDYILEIYLNEINLGRGNYGVQAAANHYYGKELHELTLAECATIAAITQNPFWFPPDLRPENNWLRASAVLDEMLDLEFITEQQHRESRNRNVYDNIVRGVNMNTDGTGVVRSYFVDQLFNEVSRDLMEKFDLTPREASNMIYSGGLQIHTTQDTAMQDIVDKHILNDENYSSRDFEIDVIYRISTRNNITNRINNHERRKTVKKLEDVAIFTEQVRNEILTANDEVLNDLPILIPQPQVAFVVIDQYNGQVKAINGGRGEKIFNRDFNRATDAKRSPGSQFKVLASYAPALDLGRISPSTVLDDAPYYYNDGFMDKPYAPRNWWGNSYEGLSSVRRGVYRSMNILAVRNMIENASIETAYGYLLNFGFTTLVDNELRPDGRYYTDKVASLPLGGLTDGVTQLELCASYAAIANLGEYNRPIFYTRVLDHENRVLLENRSEPRRVIKDTTAYMLTDMMIDTVRIGTGTRLAFQNVKMPIAGKTGTTTDTKDLGFTGYTPYYTAAIWLGFDQQKKIQDENTHRYLWRDIMEEIHENLPEKAFERPPGIVNETICRDSGQRATDLCRRDPRGGRTPTDLFAQGNIPPGHCDMHQEIRICIESGERASYFCNLWEMRVVVVSPDRNYEEGAKIEDADYVLAGTAFSGPECSIHSFGQNQEGQWNPGDSDGQGFFTPTNPGGFGAPEPQPSIGDYDWNTPFFPLPSTTEPDHRPEFDDPIPFDFWNSF